MIDKDILRNNPELLRAACEAKGVSVDFETLIDLDSAHRKLLTQEQELQAKINQASEQFPQLPEGEKEILKKEILVWKKQLEQVKEHSAHAAQHLETVLLDIPNPPAPDVKIGAGYDDNEIIREVKPSRVIPSIRHSFSDGGSGVTSLSSRAESRDPSILQLRSGQVSVGMTERGSASSLPNTSSVIASEAKQSPTVRHSREGGNLLLDHVALGQKLGVDMERAGKVSGSRFAFLRGQSADWAWALAQHGVATAKKYGFEFVLPPVLVKADTMQAMGYLQHGGEEETYHFEKDDLYLTATSEQSMVALYKDEVVTSADLPLRFVGYSSCFRREAGSYGKDVRGLIRVHQFEKVEMVVYATPENGDAEHEKLLAVEEDFVKSLGLPYRVVKMCSGDLGDPAARKYDIECWLPSENTYRETHSCSLCTDFQARRLNLKYKEGKEKPKYLYTLNGTVVAIGRMLSVLWENYQEINGTVSVPDVLKKYLIS